MNTLGLPLQVRSEDGLLYEINVFPLTLESVKHLWDRSARHRVLFCDQTYGRFDAFLAMMLDKRTIVLAVGDVGIFYATDLIPGYHANVHFFFWDRVTEGRHKLLLTAMRWGMDTFNLHRVSFDFPRHAYAGLHRAYKIGFRIEGIEREAQLFKGKWHDLLKFAVLRSELTDDAIARGELERVETERNWFGLLKKDVKLMEYIMRRS